MTSSHPQQTNDDPWFVVATTHFGADAIVGPFASREEALTAWRETERHRCAPHALGTPMQAMPPLTGKQQP